MKHKYLLAVFFVASVFALSEPVPASTQLSSEQRQGKLQLGAEIGPVFGTADSTAFGLALYGDYSCTKISRSDLLFSSDSPTISFRSDPPPS